MAKESDDFLPGFSNLDHFNQDALKAIALATKASNGIPSELKEDWDFYTTFKSFRQVTNAQSDTIHKLIEKIVQYNSLKCTVPRNSDSRSDGKTQEILEFLSDFNDQLLERINTHLDEASGLKKAANSEDPSLVEITSKRPSTASENIKLLAGRNVSRPQIGFKDFIENSAKKPFIPRLVEKPHSLKPLSILIEYSDQNEEIYSHPYLFEMDNFKMPAKFLEKSSIIESKSIQETPLIFINTETQLHSMIEELHQVDMIGVDLEAHTYRSFQGISCLIQISSKFKDYIIDPFPLWSVMPILNEIFANPSILKIFHGSRNDILWLQRDFSVYVVNLFDTYVCTQVLDFPRGCRSLAFLLHSVVKINTDKKFQLADWRIRPLPEDMLTYARLDTHYLLQIYAYLQSKLIDSSNENLNLLRSVYDQSNELCKQRYQKPILNLNDHHAKITHFNGKQKHAYFEMLEWRNQMARMEDESENYVLPIHMMLKICMELPREMQGILACCNPVPPLVKQHLHALHEIILKARSLQQNSETAAAAETLNHHQKAGMKDNELERISNKLEILQDPIRCPLDLSHFEDLEFESNEEMETLLKIHAKNGAEIEALDKKKPMVSALKRVFLSPFERYKMLKPYMESLKKTSAHSSNNQSDEDRINSIKKHFDELTALTPQEIEIQPSKEDEIMTNDQNDASIDDYNPDPGEVAPLRIQEKSNKKKRKSFSKNNAPIKVGKFTAENVDLAQYSSGINKNTKTFDPMGDFKKNGGGNKRGPNSKNKKKGGKSFTYRK